MRLRSLSQGCRRSQGLTKPGGCSVRALVSFYTADPPGGERGTDGSALHMGRERDSTPMDVPLHPGAERWYREHGGKN